MGKGTFCVAAAAAMLLAPSASRLSAETTEPGEPIEVRVINNHASPVQVYVEDARGRMHRLGSVASAHVKELEIPAGIAELGQLEVKVYTDAPIWSNQAERYGVRTRALDPKELEVIQFWVEPNLEKSQVEFVKG